MSYDASDPAQRFMRFQIYFLESLKYCDIFFQTSANATSWWWLFTNADQLDGPPHGAMGPYRTVAVVPTGNFLAQGGFSHAGDWAVVGRPRSAFSSKKTAEAGTWVWTDADSIRLARIMNVEQINDFSIPILGSYYLADFAQYSDNAALNLRITYDACKAANRGANPSADIVTLGGLLEAIGKAPPEAVSRCTVSDIQRLLPGLLPDASNVATPAWTSRMDSRCYMIGQDLYPYYCAVVYDWDKGMQVTVFVMQDSNGEYTSRNDELLPKGNVGPGIYYSWDGTKWVPACSKAGGGDVPMPVPDFVHAGEGRCRAAFKDDPYFSNDSMWSVTLGAPPKSADFWYWFDDKQRGVIFSLSPASSLTIIDYQTFNQNEQMPDCVFEDPTGTIPACPEAALADRKKPRFMPLLKAGK
ncbi:MULTISPECIES: hypothetical protein [Paraburkholderia]|uniref:Uncharacterized protein n=1 Tax=Paraburkholderia madseniana TaxID=2599607 RepID=A0AAP5F1D4_9BURK|nr:MULTISPECIES: hypothetical protein [Paraburkholderia]MCX4151459.1 hypothetical protein [Paraburkholderia madseniana]MDN7154390.1 hypothetical protein [Paraburkholderia sp. WS6]MDQ6413272.1 hypothetical protein [Paraburkholderia madseniana]